MLGMPGVVRVSPNSIVVLVMEISITEGDSMRFKHCYVCSQKSGFVLWLFIFDAMRGVFSKSCR